MEKQAFDFIPRNPSSAKPRSKGITEIRGPYYSVMGTRYLSDVLETMGDYIDGLQFVGGSLALLPRTQVRALIDLAHQYGVYVSTGGWIEKAMTYGVDVVDQYIREAARLGFDVIEISMGSIPLPKDDLLRVIDAVARAGLKVKPELGIQFRAGGASSAEERRLISQAKWCVDAGASIIMIESEGITESAESPRNWRTNVISEIVSEIGLERLMFEAADPAVFEWYVKNFGSEVNLFVDPGQIIQLEALRSGRIERRDRLADPARPKRLA